MTNQLQALDDLIAKVEAGECPVIPGIPALSDGDMWDVAARACRGSLDAAMSLHNALLPGWKPRMPAKSYDERSFAVRGPRLVDDPDNDCSGFPWFVGQADTPARAWLIAILKAYRAELADQ